jgi:flagellar basal body-associated protein FliL
MHPPEASENAMDEPASDGKALKRVLLWVLLLLLILAPPLIIVFFLGAL